MHTCSDSIGDVRGLALALTSLNLARRSHTKPRVMAEIYFMLAIRLKISWPRLPSIIQRWHHILEEVSDFNTNVYCRRCLARATTVLGSEDVSSLAWVLGPEFTKFLLTDTQLRGRHLAEAGPGAMSGPVAGLEPVARLLRHYRDTQLAAALDTLVWPSSHRGLGSVVPRLALVTR